jgi:predicted GNAT superfamily acetyltransferase
MTETLAIRPLQTTEDFDGVVAVQKSAWDIDDQTVVPRHLLHVIAKTGGVVLGAFAESGEMVGFTLGLVSRENGASETYLTSHMVGVIPEWQSKETGYRLKSAQRDWARANGYLTIRWTYDPMESRDAALNIRKLGARVCAFYPHSDGQGRIGTAQQYGLPADQFLVEWDLQNETAENSPPDGPALLAINGTAAEIDASALHHLTVDGMATLPVPLDFQGLKRSDLAAAGKWQSAVREVMTPLLNDRRFWISGFHAYNELGIGFYAVTRRERK